MLVIPTLTIAFAGSKEPWALGGFACLVGLAFVVAPINNRISVFIWGPLVVMLLVTLTSFLPDPASAFPDQFHSDAACSMRLRDRLDEAARGAD